MREVHVQQVEESVAESYPKSAHMTSAHNEGL
ncbi:hypothetical protein EMIT0P291_140010 [Pseudomonas sp. IT-P291]